MDKSTRPFSESVEPAPPDKVDEAVVVAAAFAALGRDRVRSHLTNSYTAATLYAACNAVLDRNLTATEEDRLAARRLWWAARARWYLERHGLRRS